MKKKYRVSFELEGRYSKNIDLDEVNIGMTIIHKFDMEKDSYTNEARNPLNTLVTNLVIDEIDEIETI